MFNGYSMTFEAGTRFECASCGRWEEPWMLLRQNDGMWDRICNECLFLILGWAVTGGEQAVVELVEK